MQFLKRHKWWFAGAGLGVLLVGFLLFRPDKLFVDDVVDESLADAFSTPAAAAGTTEPEPSTTTTTTVAPAAGTDSEPMDDTTTTSSTTTTTIPSGPQQINAGEWRGIDHFAEGTVGVYEQDGRFVLRFEDDSNFQNGPDLYVWVLPNEDYEGGVPGEYIDLGKIKGNVGGQNYELPAEYDPTIHRSVLIWCLRFNVPFAAAPLA